MKTCKTQEQFEKEIYDLVGDEYTVLGNYVNANTKILMKHNKCKHEWDVLPRKFLEGTRCPQCRGGKQTYEMFIKEVYDLVGNEYVVLGRYKNNRTYIRIKHNRCGFEWSVSPDSFLKGSRCPKCAYKRLSKI